MACIFIILQQNCPLKAAGAHELSLNFASEKKAGNSKQNIMYKKNFNKKFNYEILLLLFFHF